jgi:hypothetical protein
MQGAIAEKAGEKYGLPGFSMLVYQAQQVVIHGNRHQTKQQRDANFLPNNFG